MFLTSSPWLHERSWTSVQEYLKHDDLILVPIGATEQHGRHTPLMVDTGWAIAVAEGAALATGTLVAPPQHRGLVAASPGLLRRADLSGPRR